MERQTGIVLLLVLFFMTMLSAGVMTFLSRANTNRASTQNRLPGIQAEYLAESAANHAVWRLLYEPGFNPDTTKYYMHSFAGGRYGYKVRPNTSTTFATVATVGVMGENIVRQSYVLYIIKRYEKCPGMVGYWQMDSTSGTTAVDTSGSYNHFSMKNFDGDTGWTTGVIENAIRLDGSDDYGILLNFWGMAIDDQLTIAAWVNNEDIPSGRDTILSTGISASLNYWFGIKSNNLEFRFHTSAGNLKDIVSSGAVVQEGEWAHVAVTYNADDNHRVKFYKNGQTVYETNVAMAANEVMKGSSLVATLGATYAQIGMYSSVSDYWTGKLDEVRLYKRAFAMNEIFFLYGMDYAGCISACSGNYIPAIIVRQFDASAWGEFDSATICYLPEGVVFSGTAAPEGGAFLLLDGGRDRICMVDTAGHLLQAVDMPVYNCRAITYINEGSHANSLGIVYVDITTLKHVSFYTLDLQNKTGEFFPFAGYGGENPVGMTFIERTESGTYDGHLALVDDDTNAVHIYNQGGSKQTDFRVSFWPDPSPRHIAHIPYSDNLLVAYKNKARIYNMAGNLLMEYDTTTFDGANTVKAIAINPMTCDHVLLDTDKKKLMFLNRANTNIAPTVDAGANLTVMLPNAATLAGVVSDDGLPDPPGHLVTNWTKVSGPSGVSFSDSGSTNTEVTFTVQGTYQLRLSADDGQFITTDYLTVEVIPYVPPCNGYYLDSFSEREFNNDDGTMSWEEDPWIEINDISGPTGGDIKVDTDQSNYQLKLSNDDKGVKRKISLYGATTASLTFKYRRELDDRSDDYLTISISTTGPDGPWTQLGKITCNYVWFNCKDDASYQSVSYDISAYISYNTWVRFFTSSGMTASEPVWIDDVKVTCSP